MKTIDEAHMRELRRKARAGSMAAYAEYCDLIEEKRQSKRKLLVYQREKAAKDGDVAAYEMWKAKLEEFDKP